MWNPIVSVPDHCLSFYSSYSVCDMLDYSFRVIFQYAWNSLMLETMNTQEKIISKSL